MFSAPWHELREDQTARDDDEGNDEIRASYGDDFDLSQSNADHQIDIDEGSSELDSFLDDDGDNAFALPPRRAQDGYSIIDVLADELRHQEIPSYLDQFEVEIPDAEIVVGTIPLEDVQQREEEIEAAKLRQKQLDAEIFRQREVRLAHQEQETRARLKREEEQRRQELQKQKLLFAQAVQLRTRRLGYVFQQAENRLKNVLQQQQARVQQVFGQLEHSQLPAERKRYRVEWDQIPVTLKVRVKSLRAVKDKLPRGQYVLLATLYDRLGGHALHWTAWDPEAESKEDGKKKKRRRRSTVLQAIAAAKRSTMPSYHLDRPNITQPFHHRGRFYNTDVVLNQNVYVVCPPQALLRPSNVLVFELFMLGSSGAPHGIQTHAQDHIVAWGAMPLMTPDFQYVEGKFKIPFLRGEMDSTMDKYRDIESMYTQDLSAWLCNLYFQVTVLREDIERLILRSERLNAAYDVEVDERSGLFQLPSGSCDELRARKKSAGDKDDRKPGNLLTQTPTSTSATQLIEESDGHKDGNSRRGVLGNFWSKNKKSNRVYSGGVVVPENEEPDFVHEEAGQIAPPVLSDAKVVSPYPGLTLIRSDSINNRSQSVPTIDEEDNGDRDRGTLGRLDIENHSFSVNSAFARETAHHQRFHTTRKLHYLRHELFVDMGVSNVRTMEFWLLLAVFAFTLWLRVYVHYIMQWVFLKGNRIPVFYFQPQWSTCMVKYTWKTVATHTEIGVIVFGVLGNWFLFGFLALTAAISQVYVGELPHFGSKFMVCIGIATVLDPYLVFLVDLVNHQYDCGSRTDCLESLTARACKCVNGDAFKLYYRFLAQEGSGLVGAIIAVIIYAALTCLSLVAFYSYLLHVHMNGRMLDVYRRIHSHENDLFIPHDCEISLQELQAICIQAGRWKGPRGTQRKVFVHDYVLQDPLDPNFQEKSTHIALYNIELDGRRELYRHFLKSHDGAIVELFGEIGPSANGTWQQDAGPGVASITLLYNILQDQATASDATPAADLTALFEGLN